MNRRRLTVPGRVGLAASVSAFVLAMAAAPPVAGAADDPDLTQTLLERIEQLERRLESQSQEIEELRALTIQAAPASDLAGMRGGQAPGSAAAQSAQDRPRTQPPPPATPEGRARTQTLPPDATPDATPGEASEPEEPVGQAPVEERQIPQVEALADRGGVLTRQGQLVLEPSIEYNRADTTRVEVAGFTVLPAILIGEFNVSRAERNTVVAAGTARYGVTNRLEVEAKVPFVARTDDVITRPIGEGAAQDETNSLEGYGLGDIEFGASYQINDGGQDWPFFVGNLRYKSNTGEDPFEVDTDEEGNPTELATGNGFHAIEPSLTWIWPTDPAVLYGNFKYGWNIARDVDNVGEVDPGDSYGASIGTAIALNEDFSISFGYDHTLVGKTQLDGDDAEGSRTLHLGTLQLGGSYRISDRIGLNLGIDVGVTEDAPDLGVILRMPISVF